jgi:hypothetical protein
MNVSLRLKNCCTLGLDGTKSGVLEDMDRRMVFMLVYTALDSCIALIIQL